MKVQISLFCFCSHICHKNADYVLKFHGPVSDSYILIQTFQFFVQTIVLLYEVKILYYWKLEHETVMN